MIELLSGIMDVFKREPEMFTVIKPKDGQRYRSDCGRAATQYSDTFMGRPCTPYWDTRYPDAQGWHTIGASFKTPDEAIECLRKKGFKFNKPLQLIGL